MSYSITKVIKNSDPISLALQQLTLARMLDAFSGTANNAISYA